jgi:hypothetical protein
MHGPFPPPGRYGAETLALQAERVSADLHSRSRLGRAGLPLDALVQCALFAEVARRLEHRL